jgi:hypothetical protein
LRARHRRMARVPSRDSASSTRAHKSAVAPDPCTPLQISIKHRTSCNGTGAVMCRR